LTIRLETKGRLARIILDRPPLNILDLDHLEQLAQRIEEAKDAAVIVLQASENCRCFSAGNAVEDHVPERAPAMLERFHRAIRALLDTDAITVADVRGDALGGGCEIAIACDLVYAAPGARFGQPEINVGCFPPVAAALLPRRIGWTRAVELIATGRLVSAQEAASWGLVTAVKRADENVQALLNKSAPVLRATKRALRAGTLDEAERIYKDEVLPLDDCAEGIRAFIEKRAPDWRHG
jgi:cyclohexa-1,5-dienecarbonyl-CoA hydratase